MELELKLESRLNAYVALTVIVISVFMAICQLRDENLIELMMHADAKAVDTWNEYQAERVKLHADRNGVASLDINSAVAGVDGRASAAEIVRLNDEAAQYEKSSGALLKEARAYEKAYEGAEFRNSQFDVAGALCAIALALSAVAALTSYLPLLFAAWGVGGFGMFVGVAAFAGWNFHPEFLASLLG